MSMICCTLSWSPFLIIWLILILTTCRDMGSKIVKCIFLWFCQIFFPWHWWRVLAMTPKTLLCGGDSWRMLLWARVYQYVACHDTHLLCLLVAYLPWYPPFVPTCHDTHLALCLLDASSCDSSDPCPTIPHAAGSCMQIYARFMRRY